MQIEAVDRTLASLVCVGFVSFTLGGSGAPFTFSNTNLIALNEGASPPTPASLYPSSLTVTGLTGLSITKVTITLHGLSHTFPSDIEMLLVGPQGQGAILMAQTGGQSRYSITNLTLTLDDGATNSLPIYTSLVSGTFKPTDGYVLALGYPRFPHDFPPPAPAGNSNSPSVLSIFKNTDPSGAWSLFIVDNGTGDTGSIAGGWTLTVSVGVPLQIARFQTNVVLSWPAAAANYSLQSRLSLGPSGSWSNVPAVPGTNLGRLMVTNPASRPGMFFRLIGP